MYLDGKHLAKFLSERKFNFSSEEMLQAQVAEEFRKNGVLAQREVVIGRDDTGKICRIDFMVGDVGLELKIRGEKRAIFRQCLRYCQSPRIAHLVVASSRSLSMPAELRGKPVTLVNLALALL